MSTRDDGGPAYCSRCGTKAIRRQGHQWLCARHYRFGQMRARARRDGKTVPTHQELELLLADACPDCGVVMNLLSREGERERTASLQHYRDGSIAIVCLSLQHAARNMPKDHKRCPQCTKGEAIRGLLHRQRAQWAYETQELVQTVLRRVAHPMAKEQP